MLADWLLGLGEPAERIAAPAGQVPAGGTVALRVTSSGAGPLVPATATAVAVNLTVGAGAGGDITVSSNSSGTIHLVVDCSGFFASG